MEEKNYNDLQTELTKLKKTQMRTKYKFNIMLSIIAMLVLIAATLAWFTLSNFASVNQMDLHISTAPGLYLDIENRGTDVTAWQKTLTNEMINQYLTGVNAPVIADQLLDPVTSSDGISFQNQRGNTREANSSSYLEFKVWFIATTDMWVHLSGESVEVVQGQGNSTSAVTTTEGAPKNDIISALRVSYEDSGSAAIWEPNKGAAVAGQTTFDVNGANYSGDTRLFHLDKLTPKQITFRIWAEGEDPECDDDVQDANVTVEMLFCGTDDQNVPFV